MDEETNRLLQELINAVRASGGRDTPDVEKAKKAYEDHVKLMKSGNKLDKEEQSLTTKGMKQEGQRQSLTTKAMRTTTKAIGGTLSVAQALESASTAMRDNRESFRSLNPTIEMTGSAIKMAGKVTGGFISAATSAIPYIDGIGKAAGTVVSALSEAVGEVVSAVGKTFTRELDRITGAFRTAAQTGALGADGMRGLGQQAVNAGLSFDSFAKTITKEGETLSFAFGTSAEAAKGLSDTTKAMRPFRSELLTLGIGVEQQNELTAKYIQFQQRQGRNEVQNTAALAQGSREYMKNLQELSKITGKSIEEQQKAIDATQADIRQGASIRLIERESGKAAAQATLETITTMKNIKGLENVGEGLADALSNAGTPAARAFTQVMGSAGQTVIQGLKSGTLGQAEALSMISKQFKAFYQGLGGDRFASQAAKMGTAVDPMLEAMQTFTQMKDLGQAAKNASSEVNNLAKTNDSLTKNVVSAQEEMIRSAIKLDQEILNKLLPTAAKTINEFAKIQTDVITQMVKYADILQTQGVGGLTKALGDDAKKGLNKAEEETGILSKFEGWLDTAAKVVAGAGVGAGTGAILGGVSSAGIGAIPGAIVGAITGGLSAYFESDFLPDIIGKGTLTNLFGGGKAEGGAVESGKSYIVGEKGPELLKMGKTSGVVIPGQVGPGVPGRVPGTFDVKLGDGSVVTVDSRGNEIDRKGPELLKMGKTSGGAITGGLAAYFGKDFLPSEFPGRAEGGAVESGKSYLVGEKGPELLKMGKTSGVVIPGQVGPGVPGRVPGTFDVKLGDGSVVTVDSKGNELYRKGPKIGGLQMSSSADSSTSMTYQSQVGGVNMTQDYINGQMAGQRLNKGNVSSYTSKGGVSSVNYKMADGVTVGAQGAATGGQFDALSQLRSVAGPKLGDAGGLSISNQGLTDMEGGPAAGQTQTIQGDGGSNEKILGVLQAMLDQTTKGTRLQSEQLQAARNN